MRRLSTIVVAAALVCLVVPVRPAAAQAARTADSTVARAGLGSIRGLVLDTDGRPLVGAMVSALGSTVAFVLTGRDGRFLVDALPAGPYTVRVHLDGFLPSQRQMVEVRPSTGPSSSCRPSSGRPRRPPGCSTTWRSASWRTGSAISTSRS